MCYRHIFGTWEETGEPGGNHGRGFVQGSIPKMVSNPFIAFIQQIALLWTSQHYGAILSTALTLT